MRLFLQIGVLFLGVLVISALPFGVYLRALDFWKRPCVSSLGTTETRRAMESLAMYWSHPHKAGPAILAVRRGSQGQSGYFQMV